MKTKGITIWEKHAEKIVLVLAFVGAGALTAMQFIGEPNAVSTTAGDVAPSEIDKLLQERAEELLAKLRDDAPAGVELPYPKLGFDDLLAQRNLSLSPGPVLPQFQIALAPSIVGVGLGKGLELPVPSIKAPDQVAVGQYVDALVDGVVEQFPQLQEHFEPDGPHDLIFATVRARFDLAHLRQEFRGKDGDADAAIIPSSWYNNRPEHLVDIIVEREELQDGHWTDLRTIDPIPGQTSVRKEIAGEMYVALRDDVLRRLSMPVYQLAVVQPAFYPTKGEDWAIPEWRGEAVDDGEATIRELKQNLLRIYADRERLVEDLEAAGGSLDEEDQKDDRRGGGGTGKRAPPGSGKRAPPGSGSGFGGGPGGDTGKRGGRDDTTGKDDERLQKRLKRQIMRVDVRIRSTRTKLRALGIDPDALEIIADPFAVLDGDEILVWGHDITVKPGKTYRYRVSVSVYNPFFGKKRSLVQNQQDLAEQFTLNSEPSDWTPPVRIHPLRRVFITSAASGGGQHGFGRAMAEVYLFHDGIQWMQRFPVQPGAAIGGVKKVRRPDDGTTVDVDFRTSLFVLDIVEEIQTSRNDRGRRATFRGESKVLLRDLDDPRILEMRDPRIEERDPERLRLQAKLPPTERPVRSG